MKKWLIIFICCMLVFCSGCSNQYKAPEGVNQYFYNDMVECIKLTEKTLETKNEKYIREIEKLIKKHSADNIFRIVHGLEKIDENAKNNYGLSEKEVKILTEIFNMCSSLSQYILEYFEGDYNVNKLIDSETIGGEILLKNIQEAISVMELDYEFKNK